MNRTSVRNIVSLVMREHSLKKESINERILYGALYPYILRISPRRRFSAGIRKSGFPVQASRELREMLSSSKYVSADLWRAVYVFVTSPATERVHRSIRDVYGVSRSDIEHCLKHISHEDFTTLLKTASVCSVYSISESDFNWLAGKALSICNAVAGSKLRFIQQYDPAFTHNDMTQELMTEAIRIANYYSHFSDREKILGYIRISVKRYALRVIERYKASQRRRIEETPLYRCPACHTVVLLEKQAMTIQEVVKTSVFLKKSQINCNNRFCRVCAEKRNSAVVLNRVSDECERAFVVKVQSLDSTSANHNDDDNHSLINVLPDNTKPLSDQSEDSSFVNVLTRKLNDTDKRFLDVLLNGDEGFDNWLVDKGRMGKVRDTQHEARLICEYLHIKYQDVQARIGKIIGQPSTYLVRTGEGKDASDDVVVAHSAQQAIRKVARAYRFKSPKHMQAECGLVRVKRYDDEADGGAVHVKDNDGIVIPIS